MNNSCYVYLNGKSFDGTVFVTQIADWLRLYKEKGVNFNYLHLFFYRNIFKFSWKKQQRESIDEVIETPVAYSYFFPSKGLFVYLNVILWSLMINNCSKNSDRVIIFSRMIFGKEIKILRKFIKKPIYFIFDARAASVEENKYNAVVRQHLSKSQFDFFKHISYTECITVHEADRIFAVSNQLKKYLIQNYGVKKDKFFIYPCLSDSNKFYYDEFLRNSMREELRYKENDIVYLYAGGLNNLYHVSDNILIFLNIVAQKDPNSKFLLLSKDRLDNDIVLKEYPALVGRFINKSVNNSEMVKYLNAADYGLLFRENVPMNNVASPSKFAEYMLCGLPTIISEGVGDYSELCEKEGLGILFKETELTDMNTFDYNKIRNRQFNRKIIAEYGFNNLSKQSRLHAIIEEFNV